MSNLQSRQDEAKLHVNTQVGDLAGKLANLEMQFKVLETKVMSTEQISGIYAMNMQIDIQGLQGGLSRLQDDLRYVTETTEIQRKEVESLGDRQDVKDSIETLRQLVAGNLSLSPISSHFSHRAEMKTLCDETHQQVTTELDNIKAAGLLTTVKELMDMSAQNQVRSDNRFCSRG